MAKKAVTAHQLLATGKGSKLVIQKPSGPLTKDTTPSTSHPMLHPYHGKKCC